MLSLDGWTLFFTVLNVIVLFVGLRLLLFKPVLKIISQREEMIKTQLKEAAAKEQQAVQLKNDYHEKLKDAGHKAEEIIAQAKSRAAREQSEAAVKAKEEAEKMLEKAREEIRTEQEQARKEVQADIAILAMEAARKIMKTGDVHDAAGK